MRRSCSATSCCFRGLWGMGWHIVRARDRCCRRCVMRPVSPRLIRAGFRRPSRRSWKPCGWSAQVSRPQGHADCALIGFAGAPFTVACYMVEGGGSQGLCRHAGHGLSRAGAFRAADRPADRRDGGVSGGADRGRCRSGDAVRQLGRGAVATSLPAACHPADRAIVCRLPVALSDCAGDRLPTPCGADGWRLCRGDSG